MTQSEFLNQLERIIEESKTGILITVDSQNRPSGRWITPAVLKSRPGAVYTFSTPDAPKVGDIRANGSVEWMIQNAALTEITNTRGIARILDNPALKNELMEVLAARLQTFWKVNIDQIEFIIIETKIQQGCYLDTNKGVCHKIDFELGA
jgi:general stress protein 26